MGKEKSKEIFFKELSSQEVFVIKEIIKALNFKDKLKPIYFNDCHTFRPVFYLKIKQDGKVMKTSIQHFYEPSVEIMIKAMNALAPKKLQIHYDKERLEQDLIECEEQKKEVEYKLNKDLLGTYNVESDYSLSKIYLFDNNNFIYEDMPGFSCRAWNESNGKWSIVNGILYLIFHLDFGTFVEVEELSKNHIIPNHINLPKPYRFYIDKNQLIAFEENESNSCEIFQKE